MSLYCEFCGDFIEGLIEPQQLKDHIAKLHIPQRRGENQVSPALEKDIEEAKIPKDEPQEEEAPLTPPVKEKPVKAEYKPITLAYKYEGQCTIDGTHVETLAVEVGGRLVMIAYCPHEKRQLYQQEVIPIGWQMQNVSTQNRSDNPKKPEPTSAGRSKPTTTRPKGK